MASVFAELPPETIGYMAREPVAAELLLDALALLEDLTHTVVPELESPRFDRLQIERELDRTTVNADKNRLGDIARNIEVNRASWGDILHRVETGQNRPQDVANYIHGARTYRDFVIETADRVLSLGSGSERITENPSRTALYRSVARLTAASFPVSLIANDVGLDIPSAETAMARVRSRAPNIAVVGDAEYGLSPEELEPRYLLSDRRVYAFRSSNGTVYFLHSKLVTLRGGKEQRIYFFARSFRPVDAVASLPDGYTVQENPRNGFLTLKKR